LLKLPVYATTKQGVNPATEAVSFREDTCDPKSGAVPQNVMIHWVIMSNYSTNRGSLSSRISNAQALLADLLHLDKSDAPGHPFFKDI